MHILLCVRFHNNTNCPLFFIPCLSSNSHGGLDIYTVPLLSPLRSGYNPLGAGSSRRPPSGAMGIPPAGARAPYRAPTGEVPVPSAIILISCSFYFIYYNILFHGFHLAHFIFWTGMASFDLSSLKCKYM